MNAKLQIHLAHGKQSHQDIENMFEMVLMLCYFLHMYCVMDYLVWDDFSIMHYTSLSSTIFLLLLLPHRSDSSLFPQVTTNLLHEKNGQRRKSDPKSTEINLLFALKAHTQHASNRIQYNQKPIAEFPLAIFFRSFTFIEIYFFIRIDYTDKIICSQQQYRPITHKKKGRNFYYMKFEPSNVAYTVG